MNDEYREIEVVQVGSGPPKPARPPRTGNLVGNRTELLLALLVVGVFLVAAGLAYQGWTAREVRKDTQIQYCMYASVDFSNGDNDAAYDHLSKGQKQLIDRFDCDVPGR